MICASGLALRLADVYCVGAFVLLDDRRAKMAAELLENKYKSASYYLNFGTPLELMVAAIISAQTRDEVVNGVTPELFKRYKTAKDYASAQPDELLKYISRVSFAGAKAKNIIGACRVLVERHNGSVPKSMEALLELPGVGRKTANTILINAYGIVEGIPVDTWVIKLSGRIGFSRSTKPDDIERDLMRIVDKRHWHNFGYVLKTHGKSVCQSQVPLCSKCLLGPGGSNRLCPRNGIGASR